MRLNSTALLMPAKSKPRLLPSTFYHVYNRGNNRRAIFKDDADYTKFLQLLPKYLKDVMQLYSYALLPDHFHLLIRVFDKERLDTLFIAKPYAIGNTFGHLQNAYAKYFLNRYKTTEISGLFERSFERKPITSLRQLHTTIHYVNFNAVHHGYCDHPGDYKYTSLQELLHPVVEPFVDRQAVYTAFGGEAAFRTATLLEAQRRSSGQDLEASG